MHGGMTCILLVLSWCHYSCLICCRGSQCMGTIPKSRKQAPTLTQPLGWKMQFLLTLYPDIRSALGRDPTCAR